MIIKEINKDEFDTFAKNHILKNYFQTKEYGELMTNSNYNRMYIGAYKDNTLVAGSLILYKTISMNIKYGYAPRGFLIDYYNTELLISFTKKIKEYFLKKGFAFIKINPEITLSTINFKEKSKSYNSKSKELIKVLKENGYDKLRDNLYFESLLPKYSPIIYLPTYDFNELDISLKNNIEKNMLSGLKIQIGTEDDIEKYYSFINDKVSKTLTYFKCLYKTFKKSDMIDLILCKIDYSVYAKYLQKEYVNETEKNEKINKEFYRNPNNIDLYNAKTKSDQTIDRISNEIKESTIRMKENEMTELVGGAIIIKQEGRINILSVGYSNNFDNIDIKTFIYYKIIEEYKKAGYSYVDLNGITADFSDTNPYKKLNEFKLKFKPKVYEYIGEFDLITNKPLHQILYSTNKIQKEFYNQSNK